MHISIGIVILEEKRDAKGSFILYDMGLVEIFILKNTSAL